MTARLIVLGAGLCGLSASAELRRRGVPHRLLERAPEPGGLASTSEEAGYRFDRTGHLLHLRDPGLRAELEAWMGPGALLELERRSVVWSHGAYTRYPFQANVHGLPPEVALDCVAGFVRAREKLVEAGARGDSLPEPRDFEAYVLRHFGEGIARHFMVPYNQKLWGVHPREISAAWCERFVPRPSLDEVLRGAFGLPGPELGYNARFLYPRFGIGELVRAFAARAGSVETGHALEALHLGQGWALVAGERLPFDAIVSSLPLDVLAKAVLDPTPAFAEARDRLRKTSLYYLDLALNTPAEQPWHWCYVPDPSLPFYRVGCYSNFSGAMAPVGKASLYVELASREEPELGALLPVVAEELVRMRLLRAPEAIRFARLRRLEHAYVIFDEHHESAVATLRGELERAGILSTGRYGRWTYASMEDAIVDGREAAGWAERRLDERERGEVRA
jgi:protoporphyrinogen oxidase